MPAAHQAFQTPAVAPVYVSANPMARVNSHVRVLGILWLVSGILRVLGLGWLWFVGRMFLPSILTNFVPGFAEHGPLEKLVLGGMAFASGIIVLQAGLAFVAAWGLLERQSWGRIVGIIAAVLSLLQIPFGTALGIYTLWVLLPASSEVEYRNLARA
ncbi:MAG: hypothetical protein ACYDDI_06725 [Candidatus Acidiferrales bacterium]